MRAAASTAAVILIAVGCTSSANDTAESDRSQRGGDLGCVELLEAIAVLGEFSQTLYIGSYSDPPAVIEVLRPIHDLARTTTQSDHSQPEIESALAETSETLFATRRRLSPDFSVSAVRDRQRHLEGLASRLCGIAEGCAQLQGVEDVLAERQRTALQSLSSTDGSLDYYAVQVMKGMITEARAHRGLLPDISSEFDDLEQLTASQTVTPAALEQELAEVRGLRDRQCALGDTATGRRTVRPSASATVGASGLVAVEGNIVVAAGVMQICQRWKESGCIDGITIDGLEPEELPRVASRPWGLLVEPPIMIHGTLDDGMLRQAGLPTMYRVDVTGLMIDRVGFHQLEDDRSRPYSATVVAKGQRLGLIMGGAETPTRNLVLVNEHGDELELRLPPPCPPGASCIGGFVYLDTDDVRPGTYQPREDRPSIKLEIRIEDEPHRWPPTSGQGPAAHSPFEPGLAPPP